MLSNGINKNGKRFDDFMPYRLIIKVTKGDKKGELIERIANGTTIGHQTAESAQTKQTEFLALVNEILTSNYGGSEKPDFASYGMCAVVNEETGHIVSVAHIGIDSKLSPVVTVRKRDTTPATECV